MQKKIDKIFFCFQIIASELGPLGTRFYWERILVIGCEYVKKQSQDFRYYQNRIFRGDFLSDWAKYMTKILLCRFKNCFGHLNMLAVHNCSEKGLFRHLTKPLSAVYNLRNKKPLRIIFFFKVFEILYRFGEWKKSEKILFDFETIALELVPLDTSFYWERILVIGCEYVNKQSQDFRYY